MHHRSGDPPVKITREIPLPWLVSTIAVVAFQAILLWSKADQTFNKQSEIATDVRMVREKVEAINGRSIELKAQMDSLERRVSQLENRVQR